jgi:hypothetical protein
MGLVYKHECDEERLTAAPARTGGRASKKNRRPKGVLIQRGSVLDCGGPPPLWHCRLLIKSARGLAQSKTWRQFGRTSTFSAYLRYFAVK